MQTSILNIFFTDDTFLTITVSKIKRKVGKVLMKQRLSAIQEDLNFIFRKNNAEIKKYICNFSSLSILLLQVYLLVFY